MEFLEQACPALSAPLYLAGNATSSLDVAHALIRRGLLPEWGSVLALRQTAGRGQLRRTWASPEGNIYAALRLPLAGPLLTEAAAPAVGSLAAAALTALGYAVFLKWPNDILQAQHEEIRAVNPLPPIQWRKVGGILLEQRGDTLVAGMGLNLVSAPPASALREGAAVAAGTLLPPSSSDKTFRNAPAAGTASAAVPLWTRLAGGIFSCYFSQHAGDEAPWWPVLAQRYLAFRGCRVRLEDAVPEHESGAGRFSRNGVIEGLCASGALRLRTESGVETFLGGSLIPLG